MAKSVENQFNKLAQLVNELGEYVRAITIFPPQGEYAKEQVSREIIHKSGDIKCKLHIVVGKLLDKIEGEK